MKGAYDRRWLTVQYLYATLGADVERERKEGVLRPVVVFERSVRVCTRLDSPVTS